MLSCEEGIDKNQKSAYDLLKEEELLTSIVTFSAAFDNMIGGGIPIGKITEICGAPGTGKTQFGIQIAVSAQIPTLFGGIGGEALFVDTEGNFITERALEIAEAASKHIQDIAMEESELSNAAFGFTKHCIMNGIHVARCHNYNDLMALSYILSDIILGHPKVKVVIVDSIAFHFRHEFEDMGLRTRLLHTLVQSFMKVAYEYKIAVVFMNQMTTKLTESFSELAPALGQSWAHACTNRIILRSVNGKKYAQLVKSSSCQEATVAFEITEDGIRDSQ
ncbi:DNA repair protein RAD51 homolog 3 isoform X2 [Hydra vulgaris]|uniref:DNA repair protein RAD51 homolog 3 n=1 Tax=Hydra vulgaris TaxID=6087 RepID=A0ABM4CNS5_HYDVU